MFKVGDKVRVIADEAQLKKRCVSNLTLIGKVGVVIDVRERLRDGKIYGVRVDGGFKWEYYDQDLELVEEEVKEPHGGEERVYAVKPPLGPIRTFDSGATRDTDQGKLDYLKALSPIVLRRYVQYLDKHRLQPDGSYRDFDNWKKGIPEEAYISGSGRHFMDNWLLTEGYATEDNHGSVELQDAICAQLFNLMGRLHEMLKEEEKDESLSRS